MGFGLGKGRRLDTSDVGIEDHDLPPLPDDVAANPASGRLDPREWFPTPAAPLELEIGSGKGTFLLQQAETQTDANFLGIEWAGEFWAYAADRVRRRGLPNVRLLHADAAEFLRWRVPDAAFRVIHLYFPDPWPKSRHHKRRMVQDRFLAEAWRTLAPRGELRVVTDHDDYWAWMQRHFDRWTPGPDADPDAWAALGVGAPGAPFERLPFERPESAGDGEVVGTNFERKYRREGRPFHAARLRKTT